MLVNIADQWTRTSHQKTTGALLGISSGTSIQVFSSFDLPTEPEKRLEYFHDAVERSKIVFKEWDVVGFYSTGELEEPLVASWLPQEVQSETSLHLVLNPALRGRDLPIVAYEAVLETGGKVRWVQRGIRIESGEAERIAVGHVARVATSDTEGVLGAGCTYFKED